MTTGLGDKASSRWPRIKYAHEENAVRARTVDVATVVRTITPVKTRAIKSRLSARAGYRLLSPSPQPLFFLAVASPSPRYPPPIGLVRYNSLA